MTHYRKGFYFKYFPILVGLIIAVTGFYLAYYVKNVNENEFLTATLHTAELLQTEVKNIFSLHFSAIERMGKRWEHNKGLSYSAWKEDARVYIEDMPAFKSISWINPDFNSSWTMPLQQNEERVGFNFKKIQALNAFLIEAKKNETFMMPAGSFGTQKNDYLILYPLFYNHEFHGFIMGLFNGKTLLQTLFKNKFVEGYFININQNNTLIMQAGASLKHDVFSDFKATARVKTHNLNWQITVLPSNHNFSNLSLYLPLGIALSGIVLGVLFSLLFYLIGQHSKITHKALAAREETVKVTEETRLILEKATEGFISIDEHSRIINWNPYACALFGWSKEEVLNKPIQDFIIPPKYREKHLKGMSKFLSKGEGPVINQSFEITACHRTKGEFPIELTIFPVKSNERYTFHAFIRDISERKNIEKIKNDFISVVSHELRTPLTAIKGSIGLLLGLEDTQLPEKYHQLLTIAQKNSDRLIRLINDILDIEKIEAGKMDLKYKTINITSLVQDAIHTNEGYAHTFNVTLSLENPIDVKISGDYDKLMQVVTNLISNAVKFSKPGDMVTIRLKNKVQTIEIAIIDQGEGIPESFKDKVFDKFAQYNSTSARKNEGTGLGLSISKAIIERHKGTINFISKEGEGTTFFVELPSLQNKIITRESQKVTKKEKSKILVCEDDQDCAKLLSMMLNQNNFSVDIAYTAHEAKQYLKHNQYEAMTLDLMLPDQNGIAFIKELQQRNGKTVPIIVVSAFVQESMKKLKGNAFPVVGWIGKPINQERLNRILKNIVKKLPINNKKILHIEDDADLLKISELLFKHDATILSAQTLADAKTILKEQDFDLVILDLDLPDGNGTELLPIINWKTKQIVPVVIFSAYELEEQYAQYVDEQLMKSSTSNDKLITTIQSIIKKTNT